MYLGKSVAYGLQYGYEKQLTSLSGPRNDVVAAVWVHPDFEQIGVRDLRPAEAIGYQQELVIVARHNHLQQALLLTRHVSSDSSPTNPTAKLDFTTRVR